MNRSRARRRCLAAVAAAGLAPILASQLARAAEMKPLAEVGKPAPAFDAPDTDGHHRTLSSLHGKTVVLEPNLQRAATNDGRAN